MRWIVVAAALLAPRTVRGAPAANGTVRVDTEARAALELAEAAAARHEGDFVLVGQGVSMAPYYQPGTALVVHPTAFFMLRAGMPVVYEAKSGRLVAHVLVRELKGGWVVRGANNDFHDDELVTPRNLVGIVRHAFVPAAPASRRFPTTIGTLLLH